MSGILTIALAYDDAGLCVIPAVHRDKIPALKSWRRFQRERPNRADLRDWFDGEHEHNIAIVCGGVSDSLAVLDFDEGDGFELWAREYPELVTAAPIVRTGGPGDRRHVYLRTRQPSKSKPNPFNGCDYLKAEGGYVIAPTSQHKSGRSYTLLSGNFRNIPVLDSIPMTNGRAETDTLTADTTKHIACVTNAEEAIAKTLPTRIGERNRRLFHFARLLKGIPNLDTGCDNLRRIVAEWFARCVHIVGTKDFDTTWIDFVVAWERIKHPPGFALDRIIAEARAIPIPPAGLRYHDEGMRLLVSVCWCLQRLHGSQPFFLSARLAAKQILGTNPMDACRKIGVLVFDGVLKRVSSGDFAERQAAEFRFIGEGRP